MRFFELEYEIKTDEGFSAEPYQDTLKVWTIGYGFTSIAGNKVAENTAAISVSTADFFLQAFLYQALSDAAKFFPPIFTLSEERQRVLVKMAYQMGWNRLSKFKRFCAALHAKDYVKAASEMRNSLWYKQTPVRAERYAQAMEHEI